MPSAISSVFAFRDFTRIADSGSQTLVRLIIANPEKITPDDLPAGTDWYSVQWQVQGLGVNPDGTPSISQNSSEDFDPLAAMLHALYAIRALFEATPEGRSGNLKWVDIPEDPTWGLPAYQPPTWAPTGVGGTGAGGGSGPGTTVSP